MVPLVRLATLRDLDAIMCVDTQIFEKPTYPRVVWRQYFDLYAPLLFVAETESGEIAGYGVGAVAREERRGWILTMGVRGESRRSRYGRQIVDCLIKSMGRDGATSVSLTVKPTNEPARRLYEGAGFAEVGSEPAYFGEGEPRLIYQIALASRSKSLGR